MKKYNWILIVVMVLGLVMGIQLDADAQCAMCKATAEQGDQRGLNLGILYLFLMPYTIVATIAFVWWRNRKKEDDFVDDWNRQSQLN